MNEVLGIISIHISFSTHHRSVAGSVRVATGD